MTVGHMSRVVQGYGAGQSCAYCHGFGKIPPLIRGNDGKMYLNPDFEIVKRFTVRAEPWGSTLAAGASADFAITVPAEGESHGDLLINELLALYDPDTSRNITIEILNTQTTRTFQNAPVYTTLMMGNAHLSCCMPCCTLVQATNTLQLRVTNREVVPVDIRIAARGKRFLPKSDELRGRMLAYWNSIPSYPYWLTLDDQEVAVPVGGAPVDVTMTVQGTGDFEIKRALCEVLTAAGAAYNPDDIQVTLTEQNGRQMQSDPLPLGSFVATPTLAVAGFPGGLYRAASACHCPPVSQLLKRNTRLRIRFENTGAQNAVVRLTFAGCFHQVPECPPGRSMDRIRSLEPTIGPLLIPQGNYCPPREAQTGVVAPASAVPQAPPPGGVFQVPVPHGGGVVGAAGQTAYVSKYYQPGAQGGAVAPGGAAHGYNGAWAAQRGLQNPGGMGSQVQLQPGQKYWDALAQVWRTA